MKVRDHLYMSTGKAKDAKESIMVAKADSWKQWFLGTDSLVPTALHAWHGDAAHLCITDCM